MTPEEIAAAIEPPTKEQARMVEELNTPAPVDPAAPIFNDAAIKLKSYNSELRIMETVLTLGQLSLSRKPEIRAGKAVMMVRSDSYDANSSLLFMTGRIIIGQDNPLRETGNCREIINAGINSVMDIIETRHYFTPAWMAGILHEPSLAKEPKKRRYNIESILGSTIIELARLAPMNPTLRSHLTAIYRVPPPKEADTFQKLKDWMEFEFDVPYLEGPKKTQYGINLDTPRRGSPTSIDPQRRVVFEVDVEISGKQVGSCRYAANAKKVTKMPIIKLTLDTWVRDGMSVDRIVEELEDYCSSTVDLNMETAETSGHEHMEYMCEDVVSMDKRVNSVEIKKSLVDFIRRTYGTQEAQQIIDRE